MGVENQPERRRNSRIKGSIPASVRGMDTDGAVFELGALLDDLSAGGLYVRLRREVSQSAELSFTIHLPVASWAEGAGMRFAAQGVVRRVEPSSEGSFGLGVEFTSYRQVFDEESQKIS